MTSEYLRSLFLIMAFILGAITLSEILRTPIATRGAGIGIQTVSVRTIAIDPDTEIERQENWQ